MYNGGTAPRGGTPPNGTIPYGGTTPSGTLVNRTLPNTTTHYG